MEQISLNVDTLARTNDKPSTKSVLFGNVIIYHFGRSQGFTSVPSKGGATLGMKCKHFLKQELSVDMHEEVRRRSHREILLRIRFYKERRKDSDKLDVLTSSSESDEESYSDYSDISDSELDINSYIFLQPISVKHRRSLLKASGVGKIDVKEKKECNNIRESRDRSGCKCVGTCSPDSCSCIRLGINCHVDRISYPCGCSSSGCQNEYGRTEFDIKRVRGHLIETLIKLGLETNLKRSELLAYRSSMRYLQTSGNPNIYIDSPAITMISETNGDVEMPRSLDISKQKNSDPTTGSKNSSDNNDEKVCILKNAPSPSSSDNTSSETMAVKSIVDGIDFSYENNVEIDSIETVPENIIDFCDLDMVEICVESSQVSSPDSSNHQTNAKNSNETHIDHPICISLPAELESHNYFMRP